MLAKENRLTTKESFNRLLKYGQPYYSPLFVLKKIENKLNCNRFGFIISKKIAKKAVIRNKLKRRLREILRKEINQLKTGYDLVIIPKKGKEIEKIKYQQLKDEIILLEKKANLIK